MSTQPKALRLADELEMWTLGEPAADELRRLHALNAELVAALHRLLSAADAQSITLDERAAARAAIAKATGGAV